jgi:hypothetical protein
MAIFRRHPVPHVICGIPPIGISLRPWGEFEPESPTAWEMDKLHQKLESLKTEHRDLDYAIATLTDRGPFDQVQVQRLKKRKLWLRDMIAKLEAELHPDIIA